jgi:hypothetical protein
MSLINTAELTFNAKVKALVKVNFPSAHNFLKRHVAGVGHVHYIRDKEKRNLAFVYREKGQMVIMPNKK